METLDTVDTEDTVETVETEILKDSKLCGIKFVKIILSFSFVNFRVVMLLQFNNQRTSFEVFLLDPFYVANPTFENCFNGNTVPL